MFPHSKSLRASLTARLTLALVALGIIGTFAAYELGAQYANVAYDQALFDDVNTLAQQITVDADGTVQVNLPAAALKWLLADEGEVVRYRVTDLRNGKVLAANGQLGERPTNLSLSGQSGFRDFVSGHTALRVAYLRHDTDPSDVPVLIEIAETTKKRDRMTKSIFVGAALFMATVVVVAVGLVWHGVGSGLAPLALLEAEATQRLGADLRPLDRANSPIEVHGLIDAINRLMARIAVVLDSQSNFIANAAHQLRTPLAGLRLQAQLANKTAEPELVRASLIEVEASAARAAHLVDQILVLSKAEVIDPLAPSPLVDLGQIAHQIIERFLPLADQRNIDLGCETGTGNFQVSGNEVLFGELIGNLVDNALRYGHTGGHVTIEIYREANEVLVAVSDDGPGFSATDRARVFQRFYRSDMSRSDGAGLGLAIVSEIAERYHAELNLDSVPGKGSRFELRFPDPKFGDDAV